MSATDGIQPAPDRPSPAGCGIKLSAEVRLQEGGYAALRCVSCTFESGVLHLHGCVPSYYLKQVAQALVADVEGIRAIVNEIEVRRSPAEGRAAGRFAWAE